MPTPRSVPSHPHGRLDLVDLARGLAIVQMVAYHFIYDLSYFGWIKVVLTASPAFVAWRSAIVTQFLLLVGIGIGLGHAGARPQRRFWKRWMQIAGAAALVSAGSVRPRRRTARRRHRSRPVRPADTGTSPRRARTCVARA